MKIEMNRKYIVLSLSAFVMVSASFTGSSASGINSRESIAAKYAGMKPVIFSEWTPGVKSRIETGEKIIVITLDACGGKKGSGYDSELISLLREYKIPASLFMTGLWIDANPGRVKELAADPLFEIENHGMYHKPASVNGAKVYGRRGTKSPAELFDEIENNSHKIEKLTGRRPLFYRPGTAYFDDVAVKIVYDLKHIPMNFSVVSGDAAGFSPERIERRILSGTKNGSVLIAHINMPGGSLLPAMRRSIIKLKGMGYRFVKLSDYRSSLK